MSQRSILITGANRGLGLEFVKQLVAQTPSPRVLIAACRKPEAATELAEVAKTCPCVKLIQLDVASESSLDAAFEATTTLVGNGGLNVIINNAGINFRGFSIDDVTSENMLKTFQVNVIGPTMICKKFLPPLKTAADATADVGYDALSWKRAAVINISSELASIARNDNGMYLPYRASKTALNQTMKSIGLEFASKHGILVVSLSPGWARTDMGGNRAPLSPEESVQGMLNVMETLDKNSIGKMIDYDGSVIPN